MIKNYFLVLFLSFCFFCNAQVKMYEYPSQMLTEEGIEKLVEQSRQNGTSPQELKIFNKLLHDRMRKQKEDAQLGAFQKNGMPVINSTACTNAGFENGTTSGWNQASADINSVTLPCNTCPTGSTSINAVVTGVSTITGVCTNGVDSFGHFPVIAPGGGMYSLLLNDASYMGKMQQITYSYVVDASSNIYTYQFAVVLNSGGHTPDQNPYFYVAVTDITTGQALSCTQNTTSAPSSGTLPGWSISPTCGGSACNTVYYKTWTTVSLDLSSAIGHTVEIKYIVSDCSLGGHFGYVYLDGSCGFYTANNSASICSGGTADLCGPAGYNGYTWTGPQSDTTRCLSINTPGTYTLNLATGSACAAPTLTYSVSVSTDPPPVISISGIDTLCFGTSETLTASGASTYTWTNGVGNGVAFTPTATATYIVSGTDTAGCSAKDSITVVVNTCSTEIKNKVMASPLKLFPNPANNIVTLQSEETLGLVLIYNSLG